MNNELKAALAGAIITGSIAFVISYFQYEKISKPTLENKNRRIELETARFNNETLRLQADIENIKSNINQLQSEERNRNLNLIIDDRFQAKVKVGQCTRYEGFSIKKKPVIKISCSATNEGKYNVVATSVEKQQNVRDVFFYPENSYWVPGSNFNVTFYVRLQDKDSEGKARIIFSTDPMLIKDIQETINTPAARKIRTSVGNIVTF